MEDFDMANYAVDSIFFSTELNHKSAVEELQILSSV